MNSKSNSEIFILKDTIPEEEEVAGEEEEKKKEKEKEEEEEEEEEEEGEESNESCLGKTFRIICPCITRKKEPELMEYESGSQAQF